MGVNAASNAPRMLTSLAEAYRRGAQIVHVNPLVEAAARRTIVPHEILAMATFQSTRTSTLNVQPRIAGDLALLRGVAKHLFERAETDPKAIDREFIERYTTGFEAYRSLVEATSLGGDRAAVRRAEAKDPRAGRGLPQSRSDRHHLVPGRDPAGTRRSTRSARSSTCCCCAATSAARGPARRPVRGHTNVQGNRTCGIDHRPGEAAGSPGWTRPAASPRRGRTGSTPSASSRRCCAAR